MHYLVDCAGSGFQDEKCTQVGSKTAMPIALIFPSTNEISSHSSSYVTNFRNISFMYYQSSKTGTST